MYSGSLLLQWLIDVLNLLWVDEIRGFVPGVVCVPGETIATAAHEMTETCVECAEHPGSWGAPSHSLHAQREHNRANLSDAAEVS